ncbi:YicC/YloC family endoribonuclease [Kaarinaea lacus]
MVHSMTAFARQSAASEVGQLTIELKSVNHRYSEVSLRLPEDLRFLEPQIRERIAKAVKRGKVDCNVKYQAPELQAGAVAIDADLLNVLTSANKEIEAVMDNPAPSRAVDFLKWPGVIKAPEQDAEALQKQALTLMDAALAELLETRQREGAQLKQTLSDRCDAMEKEVQQVKQRLPIAMEVLRQRLVDRLADLKGDMDENRLEQEMVMLANKSDVAEEVDRLAAHIIEVRRVLEQNNAIGRRLDFLMQELNREANTLSAKSVDTEQTRSAVELKVLIEQMREQVQNIE